MKKVLLAFAITVLTSAIFGGSINYTYDAVGRLIRVSYGENRYITYTYDANGNLLSRVVTAPSPCSVDCEAIVPPAGRAGVPVRFTSTTTTDNCSGAPAFFWSFGDGSSSTEQNPSHSFATAGNFGWILTVTADAITCSKGGSIAIEPGIPGDCDGDGSVSIGEVQKAINMFLGAAAPDCGVDCDGNGQVSIGELQKVINAFLGMPSRC